MILFRLLNSIMGYRTVSVEGSEAERIANLMMEEHIDYWNMKREGEGELTFELLDKEYRRLHKRVGGETVTTIKRYGLPSWLSRYRNRLGIPLGLCLFFLLMQLSTQYVWHITVSGNETMSDAAVTEALEKLGCGIGAYIPGVDFYEICHRFILENEEVSWISVNMVGTHAMVEIRETNQKELIDEIGNGTPTNLLSRYDGVVVRTESIAGAMQVKAGQPIKKGELLVSGVVPIGKEEEGRFVLVRSRGAVYAEIVRHLEVTVPLTQRVLIEEEGIPVKKSLIFFGKTIKIQENSSILASECDIIQDKRRIVLFEGSRFLPEIPLPLYWVTDYARTVSEEVKNYTEEEALAIAESQMATLFANELADAEILLRTDYVEKRQTADGEALVLTWEIRCIQDVTEETPLGLIG